MSVVVVAIVVVVISYAFKNVCSWDDDYDYPVETEGCYSAKRSIIWFVSSVHRLSQKSPGT